MTQALLTSWLGYTRNVVKEARPDHVIVVGKGVARAIEPELVKLVGENYSIIAQPNARPSAEDHLANFRTYYHLCLAKQGGHDSVPTRCGHNPARVGK